MGSCESCNKEDEQKYQEIVRNEQVIFENDPFVPVEQRVEQIQERVEEEKENYFKEEEEKKQTYDSSEWKLEKVEDKVIIQLVDGSTYEG